MSKRDYANQRVSSIVIGVIIAIICISTALFIASLEYIYIVRLMEKGATYNPRLFAFSLALLIFGGILGLAFLWSGLRVIRGTLRSISERLPEGVDLDKEPWLVNQAWRERRIPYKDLESSSSIIWLAWGFMFALFMFIGVVVFVVSASKGNSLVAFITAITVVAMITGIGYLYLRKRKFGTSICHLNKLPAVIGDALEVDVETRFLNLPNGPVKAVLANLTIHIEGGSRVRYARTEIHWQAERNIPVANLKRLGYGKIRIPIEIEIPDHVRKQQGGRDSFWRLRLNAPFPGLDYQSEFIVPVYDVH